MQTDNRSSDPFVVASLEYEAALDHYRHFSSLRRQDMAFVTTVQGAALAILGPELVRLADPRSWLLSLIAVLVLLLGLNSERRASAYMTRFACRAREIESQWGMHLLSSLPQGLPKRRVLISNATVFPLFYVVSIAAWMFLCLRAFMA